MRSVRGREGVLEEEGREGNERVRVRTSISSSGFERD